MLMQQEAGALVAFASDENVRNVFAALLHTDGTADHIKKDLNRFVVEQNIGGDNESFHLLDEKGKLLYSSSNQYKSFVASQIEFNAVISKESTPTPVTLPYQENNDISNTPLGLVVDITSSDRRIGYAVLTIDINAYLSKLFELSRIGKTGETYAFDRNAFMLNDSRFTNDVLKNNFLVQGQYDGTKTRLSDPGGSLKDGHKPPLIIGH